MENIDIKDIVIYVEKTYNKSILNKFKKTATHYKKSNYDYQYVEKKINKNYSSMIAYYILHLYYT